jgi:hypothetical protein
VLAGVLALVVLGITPSAGVKVTGVPRCSTRNLRLSLSNQGAGQGTVIGLSVSARHTRRCRLNATLRLKIGTGGRRSILRIRGNPVRATLRGRVRRGHAIERAWTWRNWCGERRRARVVAKVGRAAASLQVTTPACVESSSPSTLRREQ